ncbi:hypothetical protein ACJX0J_015549, partial [Zea mays]
MLIALTLGATFITLTNAESIMPLQISFGFCCSHVVVCHHLQWLSGDSLSFLGASGDSLSVSCRATFVFACELINILIKSIGFFNFHGVFAYDFIFLMVTQLLFGGASDSLTTDITIPIVTPNEAAQLAAKYHGQGFQTLKLKVGKNLNSDIEVLKAIRLVHPDCSFILDANEGYTAKQAIEVLDRLNEMGVTPVLFEQPVHRDDWDGLRDVTSVAMEKYKVAVAADESCRSLLDAQKIIDGNLAHVINIKLAKLGVLGALEIIDAARKANIALMIGGMVETRIAMGFAGHLAAGLGCFSFIDLDTPLLLSEDPVYGGYEAFGPLYKFTNARGHGGFLHLDNEAS